ncbi:hypothetical protein KW796_02445 [Candidatus Parcubacteria bacterium]|nr:hypothetical protein [Candidatus Parcubacteria bacterium]
MSRRALIFTIILVIVLGTGILFFLVGGKTPGGLPILSGLPFGEAPRDNGNPGGDFGNTSGTANTDSEGRSLAKFFRLVNDPVAGFVSFIKNGSEMVRYVDRATGHVYDVNPNTLEKTKIFNTTQPKVYVALWKPDASGFLERSVPSNSDSVSNTSITLSLPKATSTDGFYVAQATLLRGDTGDMAIAADGSLLYVLRDTGAVLISSFLGEKPRTLLSLPFTDWRILPINSSSALLVTKASIAAEGYAYTLNTKSGGLTKILGPLNALTAVPSPDGRHIAYAYSDFGTIAFKVLNVANGVTSVITPATLPEKCVWSRKTPSVIYCGVPENGLGGNSPDSWYQGGANYSDKIWRFNTDTGTAEVILEPIKNFNTKVDAMSLELSPDEDYLFFVNKDDLSIFALKIAP